MNDDSFKVFSIALQILSRSFLFFSIENINSTGRGLRISPKAGFVGGRGEFLIPVSESEFRRVDYVRLI